MKFLLINLLLILNIAGNMQDVIDIMYGAGEKFLARPQISEDKCMGLNPWRKPANIDLNEQPVIGVASQTLDFTPDKDDRRWDNYTSFIKGGYVRWLQSAGARVVPILIDEPTEVIQKKLESVNGVFFPGSIIDGDYVELARYILEQAKMFKHQGKFFPVWGTCQGFEYLVALTAQDGFNVLEKIGQVGPKSQYINFTMNPQDTKMFCSLGDKAQEYSKVPFFWEHHTLSVRPETMETDKLLKEFWDVTSVGYTDEGKPFVASIEAKDYPIMATQFHPEKPTQEWTEGFGIDHSWRAIKMNEFFVEQFVSMTRYNTNTFGNYSETQKVLIDNYDKIETTYDRVGEYYMFHNHTKPQ